MERLIIVVSGKKGTGKSLFAGIMSYHGFKIFSFADLLKEWTRKILNVGPEHTDGNLKEKPLDKLDSHSTREFMVDFGQLLRKFSVNEMFWINALWDRIQNESNSVIIPDARFPNEVNFMRERGAFIVRLERLPELNVYKIPGTDSSETSLDAYDFDLVLTSEKNKTPQDLEKFAYVVKKAAQKKLAHA